MTESIGQIKANPDVLRAQASNLQAVISEVDAVLAEANGLHDITAQEASYGTVDGSPAPYYSPLLQALGGATGKVVKNLEQLKENTGRDAEALIQIANAIEETEQNNAARITNI